MGKKRQRKDESEDESSTSGSSGSDGDKREEEKRSKHKKHKKEGKKHKKSKDKDKKSKGELVRQAKAFLEQHLNAGGGGGGEGAPLGGPQAGSGPLPRVQVSEVKEQLSDADYFRRHAEFAAFLAEERCTQFNDLSSERARELFTEFVQIWNEGRLAPRFYGGLVAAPLRRTEYRWNIGAAARAGAGAGGPAGAPSRGMAAYMEDQQAQQAGARLDQRRQDRSRARDLLEEVAPRETGRDKA
ncbi:hypothetical protein TSOC_013252, partial [Tetrabaena socialis]